MHYLPSFLGPLLGMQINWRGAHHRAAAISLMLVMCPFHAFAADEVLCPDGKVADGLQRAGNSVQCFLTRRSEPGGIIQNVQVMAVFLPGASSGRAATEDGGTGLSLAQKLKITTITLQAPRVQPEVYTSAQVDSLAVALAQIRLRNPGKKFLLAGHAGGAVLAALLASRYPTSADAWLLAACPCDVQRWRQSFPKLANTGIELSPQTELGRILPAMRMGVVVGNRDDNDLPTISQAYVTGLQARGVKTRLTYAVGATHVSVQRSPEFFMLAQELVDGLSR